MYYDMYLMNQAHKNHCYDLTDVLFAPLISRASGCAKSIRISKLPRRSDENIRILHKPKSIKAGLSLQSCQAGPD